MDALRTRTGTPVVGIFESSVWAAVQLSKAGEGWGIVSTGAVWQEVLEEAVGRMIGKGGGFVGVECCGVDAGELHDGRGDGAVEARMQDAVGRLMERGERGGGKLGVVVLGCAGMVGMEGWVRGVVGEGVRVVDGVRAGVGVMQGLIRGGF